jgi:hypothetical protein
MDRLTREGSDLRLFADDVVGAIVLATCSLVLGACTARADVRPRPPAIPVPAATAMPAPQAPFDDTPITPFETVGAASAPD